MIDETPGYLLFTKQERKQRKMQRDVARFILRAANPPADMVEKARDILARHKADEAERRAKARADA